MNNFLFDLQRFATQTISAGESVTLDGVTYTALEDAQLNLNGDGKVSGIASGKVSAVATNTTNPKVTFDATDGSTDFTLTSNGEVLTLTKVLPFELDNGTFTFAGNVLTAAKGSDLGIGTGRTYADGSIVFGHDYADTDITYTITDTTLTEETEQETITFTASLGEQSRSITTFVNGKIINGVADGKFTGGFTITKDSSMGLVLGDYTLKATANSDATSQILVDSNGANITPGSGDGKLNVALTRNGNEIFAGELECTSGKITLGYDKAVTFEKGTAFNFTTPNKTVLTVTANGEATTAIALTDNGITFTPGSGDGGLNIALTKQGTQVFEGSLNITDGTITFDTDTKKFSFSDGTKISLSIWNLELDIEVVGDTTVGNGIGASFKIDADANGNLIFTPDENGGSFNIALKRDLKNALMMSDYSADDDEAFFENNVTVNGPIMFNPQTGLLTLLDDTEISLEFDNYTLTATADGDASSTISLTEEGISITPDTTDGGKLNLVLSGANGTISVDVEVLSGGFVFGQNGTLNVTEGTELQAKFSDDYIVNFKATDAAGGKISIGTDGITFAPNADDGNLEISITRDGQTRTASLDMTGSLTYKLDGSISLAQGTVVKNVFEDGNILTITAKTDASGSMTFTPDNGLDITPSTPNALDILLSRDGTDIIEISGITGSVNYKSGGFTASDGTTIHFVDPAGYYNDNELKTSGGPTTVHFGENGIDYTPGENATSIMDYLQGTTWELQNGTLTDYFAGPVQGNIVLSEGATFDTNDNEFPFALEKAGNYTLNGMKITTTEAYTDALLSGYDTVQFAADAPIKISTIDGGNLFMPVQDESSDTIKFKTSDNINVTDGAITFDNATQKFSIAKDTNISLTKDGQTITFTASEDISATYKLDEETNIRYFDIDNDSTAKVSIASGEQTITGDLNFGGVISYKPETGTFGLTDANSSYGDGTDTFAEFVDKGYGIKMASGDTTVIFVPEINDGKLELNFPNEDSNTANFTFNKDGQTLFNDNIAVDGTLGLNPATQELSLTKDTELSLTKDGQVITFTAPEDISANYKVEEDIIYLDFGNESTATVSIASGEQTITGDLNFGGVLSYRKATGTFGLTGANSSHGNGTNTFAEFVVKGYGIKMATNNTTVVFIPKINDGKLEVNFPNEAKHAMAFTVSKDGQTIFENNLVIDGTIGLNPATQELSLTKDTVLTMTGDGKNSLEITALDDASGKLTLTDEGIRFAPNAGDGQLELNFLSTERKANIDVTGAIIFGNDDKLSLEDGTEVNITWEDGANLKLTSKGSTGSIGLDAEKGIKITSDDENLSMDLTTATGDETHLSGIKGTIYYNAGSVSFDDNSAITATTTLDGEPILMTLETIGGTGHLDFASNGVIYSADTGAMKITWAKGDVESTFTVNSGSVQIGHNLFKIAKGTELSTDLKDFIPALYFTTSEAGTYTINGQTITTTAEGLKLTATDDYMTFVTSDDVVEYDGMTFAGSGNVSLSPDNVVLGAGVEATGFGEGNSFVLAEAGNVTADARIFELSKIEDVPREIPMIITVTGAQDGFIFSRTLTKESEAYIDDALDDESFADYTSPYIGKVFTEKFITAGDSSYRIRTDATGLQEVIGISADTTITGGATLGGETSYNYFDIVTETNGKFVIGERVYVISEGSTVGTKLTAHFDENGQAYARGVKNLNGTVSGDFSAYKEFKVNGNSALKLYGDTDISIVADNSGYEILGLDNNASLQVSDKNSYTVNHTTINANANDYIVGLADSAFLSAVNNSTLVTGTDSDDTISNSGSDVSIDAGTGDDSVSNSGTNVTINGGAGSNQIKLTGKNEVILLKGRTTVEGFNTGFGDGSDTIYIKPENDPAGVEFLEDGLTFGNDTASLTLGDVNTTAKVNLFHENRDVLNKGVFIAAGDWYTVENSDLSVNAGEEVYFVGTAAEPTAGVDFSNITADLNITMDTEWEIPDNTMWINGIYSLKGGAGNTTVTGSEKSDTIIGGSGSTTINAAQGDDLISLTGEAALINYATGDGNDTIYGFNSTSTLSPAGTYTTQVSGNDLIVTVGESKITLKDAASLSNPNISSSNPIVQLAETILKRTALGYPAMAAAVFDPEGNYGDEPTNYVDKEDWTVTSADDLKLHAVHYTPENSNDKWVVLIHGYGNKHTAMYTYAESYLANGYNVLMIDQRAAGESEGTWLTMGAAESADVALWTQEIARRNSNAKITLHGVSMGAATAMLAAARSDTKNVTSIVEDCGYSDVMETFSTIIANNPQLGISPEVIPYLDPVAAGLTGYYLHDAAPIDSISSVKKPSLFISGDADAVAPVSMLEELYDASGAEVKEKFIVEGSKHALAVFDDSIGYNNAVFRFVAEADGEGWVTTNTTDNISLRGTKYDDTITNTGEGVTIQTGDGDDSVSNTADNVSIDAGAGNDTIYNHADNITIDGGAGNDSISNNSDNVVFIWSGGNDTIDGFKEDSVLSIGSDFSTQQSGDDVIVNVDNKQIILKGTAALDNIDIIGSDGVTIENFNSDSLIGGTSDNDSIANYGDNATVQALGGFDTIFNISSNSIIDAGTGNDSVYNYSPQGVLTSDNVSIFAGNGNDTIRNEHAYNVTLNGGDGNDKIIVVTGDHTTIDGGDGNDTILGESLEGGSSAWAMGGYANINGGDGDDYINPIFSDSASILGGAGNDTIINEGNDSTLNGGAGDDIISLHGAELDSNVIKYEVGDGNDSVFGFNDTSKLSITAGTDYSTVKSGSDVIVNIGANAITIADGASLSTINITNEETKALNTANTADDTLISGTELADTITNSGANVSIKGLSGNDSILSSGTGDSIHGGAGNDTITNSGANSTVLGEYGDDKISNTADNVLLDGSYGNDTITNSGSDVTIRPGNGYNYTSNSGDNVLFNITGGLDTIVGFSENSTLSLASDDYETLYGIKDIYVISGNDLAILENAFLMYDSLNINDKTIEVEDKVIYLLPGDDEATIGRSNVSIVSGEGDDRISLTPDATNNVIQYTEGSGNDSVFGFNETSEISIAGEYSSIKVGDDVIFKVGNESIKVVDGSSVIATDFEDGESIVLTKKGAVTLDGKVFELTKKVPSGVTITGEKNGFTAGITEDDGKIFVEEFIAAGDDSYNVSISGGGLQTISGINAGTEITTSATRDGEETDNQIYIVTEDAGSYTFNDMRLTTNNADAEIRLINDALSFKAADVAEYDGKTFGGDGKVAISLDSVILGSSVSATGFDGESFILAQKGTTTVDGRAFELTENISDGITIESADNDYTISHAITQAEANAGGLTSGYVGKVFTEKVIVEGDETYSLQANSLGLRKVSGISDGATVTGGTDETYAGQYFYVDTDTEGIFTIGEKNYSIGGDSNVLIEAEYLPEKSYAVGFASLDGTVSGNFDGDAFYVNGNKPILINGDDSIKVVGSSSGTKLFDVSDGATLAMLGGVKEVNTDSEGVFTFGTTANNSIAITVRGDDNVKFKLNSAEVITNVDDIEGDLIFSETLNTLFINGMGGTFDGDFSSIGAYDNSLYIHDASDGSKLETNTADKIWLQMVGENFTLNGNRLTLTDDSDGIWLRDKEIVGLDEGASLQVSKGGTYLVNETSLKAKAGDVIVGLENNDAYVYDASRPPITSKTSNAEIINHFNPKNYTVASGASDISLSGGDLSIIENTSARVNLTAGDDTVVSRGENVNVSLTGGNTWLFPLSGKMTLEGYDAATGAGFNFAGTNIFAAVEDGYIDFNNGNLKFGSAQVEMDKRSELMNFYNIVGRQQKVGYASTSDSLDVSDETDDLILIARKNASVTGGTGDDTILARGGNFIDGGKGSNLVSVSTDGAGSNIALNGKTTVEGFNTGFGAGSDTIYIKAESDPAVDFKTGGLTFYDGDIVALSDVTDTAKVNLYDEKFDRLRRGVFIAKNDWYEVTEDDLADSSGAGVNTESGIYFVGTSATKNHGIDFSGVKKDLNITLNTDYASTTAEFWVNNIHSIKGGAGNTTIIGSDKNDTILAGSGEQSISGGAGQDKMYGNTDADKNVATFFYMAGDGRDSIENFDFTNDAQDVTADKVQLDDTSEITDVLLRGDDVMIKVDGADGFLMLEDAKGKSFRVNDDLIAKVDTNVEFDGFTNAYVGIGAEATLTVGKDAGDVEVWLSDDSLEYHGTMYNGNFAVLDASQATGNNILAGNELNNSIVGGNGNDSLWGGYGSENDTLIGGAGQNTFFYLQGNGKDKIQNAHDGDTVILDDISLDQIADANITAGGVVINFNDGGSLTVDSTADVTYQLADGSKYSANHETQDWIDR